MPSRYQKILISVLVLLVAGSFAAYAGYRSLHTKPPIVPVETASTTRQTATSTVSSPTTAAPAKNAQTPSESMPIASAHPSISAPSNSAADTISAALIIGSQKYALTVPENTTLDDAMTKLTATDPSFTFTQHSYSGLGEFIDSINGKASTGNTYWILYTNGVDSQIGASATIVHQGDTFEWKYQQ